MDPFCLAEDAPLRARCILGMAMHWRHVAPKLVEVLLGHRVWLAQLNRSLLAIPFAAYHFVHKFGRGYEPRFTWPSVREELRSMRGALAFCKFFLVRDVLPIIASADASGFDGEGSNAKGGFGFACPDQRSVEEVILSNANYG